MASNSKKVDSEVISKKIFQATHGSPDHPLKIGEFTIPCYVLENGKRVLVRSSMLSALDMKDGSAAAAIKGDRLVKFISTKSLRDHVPPQLEEVIHNPIQFFTPKGALSSGYEATILADICELVLSVKDINGLNHQQEHIAVRCSILVRGFARVGIVALVDEATGYQDLRSRQALEEILQKFISDQLLAWAKTFPDEFYRELFRLRGLHYSQVSSKRPQYIGKLTNDIVYERLAPGVLEELKRVTPKNEKGRRKHKLFQRLTEDVGHPKLREHLSNIIILMKASPNYNSFYRLLERALPKYGSQGAIDFEFDEDSTSTI